VLCMSPVGAAFRNRLRQFPSLVNCTTIDWFHPWPSDALRSVADHFLRTVDLEGPVKEAVVDICVAMQESAIKLSEEYRHALQRYNYVTPTSYLELLRTFSGLFESTRKRIGSLKERYENGLTKLLETAKSVTQMQVTLEQLQPQLIQSTAETVELMKTIEKKSEDVARTRESVAIEEKDCNEQATAAQKIRDECSAGLAKAMPALESALQALSVLSKSDLVELKNFKVPPDGVRITMQALCILLG
jgi:dynein heavy chain